MTIKQDIQDDIEYGSLPDNVKSVNSYLDYMRKKSSYGGQVEISALSHVLNRNINVYKSDGDNYTTAGLGYTINPNNRDNDILLFHNMNEVNVEGGHHYDLLYPVDRGVIVSKQQYSKLEDKFKLINFNDENLNKLRDFIIDLFNNKKIIENSNIRATLLNSDYKGIVLQIIDKSILLHAPFLKNKGNIDTILEGWNEYLVEYREKNEKNIMKKEANKLLTNLNKENYGKFKKYNLGLKKK